MNQIYDKIEKTIGGLKFAVLIILLFSIMMVIGTFLESWYGTDYANRVVYKTVYFMGLQFLMLLSIVFATLIRLPIKKRLHGFYVIHSGLIIIWIGSFVTYVAGVDGTIFLSPMTPARQVILNEDVIEIHNKSDNRMASLQLPFTAFSKDINVKYDEIKIDKYLPFADTKIEWTEQQESTQSVNTHSSSYSIANANVAQDFILSLHPEAQDFKASLTMGLLNITYLPIKMVECFNQDHQSGLILWNYIEGICTNIENMKVKIETTKTGKRFFAFKEANTVYSFIPDISPWALDINLEPIPNSPYRVFSKDLFKEKPHLFLFGEVVSYYDKNEKVWVTKKFENNKKIELPWMGFELTLIKHSNTQIPIHVPIATTPIQSNGNLIKGMIRAALVSVKDKQYWLTNEKPLNLSVDGKNIVVYMTKKSKVLPFELTLTKFKMDKDPGTNNPASYESFISKFQDGTTTNHHVFMNNPMKHDGITFYQASYSKDETTDQYSSTLSVNIDQGRFLKYLGSILLVLGSIWHFVINNRTKQKDKSILGF